MSEPLGTPRLITLHWSAGGYEQTFPDYHFAILGSGEVRQTLPIAVKGAHTWGRNSGNIGVSLCAMHPDGRHPVTAEQREACACLVAELCGIYGLELSGAVVLPEMRVDGGRIVPTGRSRTFPAVADHATFARADGYYPDRWDVGPEYAVITAKAKWYRAEIQARRRINSLVGRIK